MPFSCRISLMHLSCDWIGPTWIIQDHLPLPRVLNFHQICKVPFASVLLIPPSESRFFIFEVPGTGTWTSSRGHYPTYHAQRVGMSATRVTLQLCHWTPDSPLMESLLYQASTQQALSHRQITMMDGRGLNRMLWIWPGFLCWLPVGF